MQFAEIFAKQFGKRLFVIHLTLTAWRRPTTDNWNQCRLLCNRVLNLLLTLFSAYISLLISH